MAGTFLAGSRFVTPGTVLVSCGISAGTFIFNPVSKMISDQYEDPADDIKYRYYAIVGCFSVAALIYLGAMFLLGEPASDKFLTAKNQPCVGS